VTRLFAAVAVTAVAVPACAEPAPPLHPWGIPQEVAEEVTEEVTETEVPAHVVLNNTAYDVCYATDLLTPVWAAYYYPDGLAYELPDLNFTADPRLDYETAPTADDFKGMYLHDRTGFDRGHVVPRRSIAPFGLEAVKESYYVTNATPQHTEFNQGFWRDLEDTTRAWTMEDDTVWVVTGPVFFVDAEIGYAKDGGRIPVPHAYFQVVVRKNRSAEAETPEALALLVPHSVEGYEWAEADSFLVAIDSIEKLTGWDFFPDLPEDLESEEGFLWSTADD
jgi:endonuclease G